MKKINCNVLEDVTNIFQDANQRKCMFMRGSVVYGTNHEESDNDVGIVVSDDTEFIDVEDPDIDYDKADTRFHQANLSFGNEVYIDIEIVKESDFIEMIHEFHPFAMEALSLRDEGMYKLGEGKTVHDYMGYFKLDKWALREKYSAIASNSWAKAKKKMTVKKDLDMYCGIKSLFHSIRLMDCAYQIATYGYINDFHTVSPLFEVMKQELYEENYTWADFNKKYKPIYNEYHSKMVKACPKPRTKNKK